jgi:hypothetical protein
LQRPTDHVGNLSRQAPLESERVVPRVVLTPTVTRTVIASPAAKPLPATASGFVLVRRTRVDERLAEASEAVMSATAPNVTTHLTGGV